MKIGIVGLPNVGKSTLFKALTKKRVDIANYPFCTIDPNVGIVQVPDDRLQKLAQFSHSKKIVPAAVEFVDIAGLVKGAAEGEGLGNKFLSYIREVDAIAEVVRIFSAQGGPASGWKNITHIYDSIDPERDIEIINMELILADIETAEKRLQKLASEVRLQNKEAIKKQEIIKKIQATLLSGKPARDLILSKEDFLMIKDLFLLTFKPVIYVFNSFDYKEEIPESLKKFNNVVLDIKAEEDIMEMTDEEKKSMGITSNLDKLIIEAYRLLGLITFLTTGEDETRAWTIKNNSTAPEAGAVIHTDFREKFIKADVINWQMLLDAGSYASAREKGLIRTEGKDYVVRDGDVIEFKI